MHAPRGALGHPLGQPAQAWCRLPCPALVPMPALARHDMQVRAITGRHRPLRVLVVRHGHATIGLRKARSVAIPQTETHALGYSISLHTHGYISNSICIHMYRYIVYRRGVNITNL